MHAGLIDGLNATVCWPFGAACPGISTSSYTARRFLIYIPDLGLRSSASFGYHWSQTQHRILAAKSKLERQDKLAIGRPTCSITAVSETRLLLRTATEEWLGEVLPQGEGQTAD